MSLFIVSLALFGVVLFMVFLHELGHFILAKKLGLYVGWGLLPNPHVKLRAPFPSKWCYLSGLWLSWIPFPLWMWFNYSWIWAIFYIAGWLGIAFMDLLVFFLYNQIKGDGFK